MCIGQYCPPEQQDSLGQQFCGGLQHAGAARIASAAKPVLARTAKANTDNIKRFIFLPPRKKQIAI